MTLQSVLDTVKGFHADAIMWREKARTAADALEAMTQAKVLIESAFAELHGRHEEAKRLACTMELERNNAHALWVKCSRAHEGAKAEINELRRLSEARAWWNHAECVTCGEQAAPNNLHCTWCIEQLSQ